MSKQHNEICVIVLTNVIKLLLHELKLRVKSITGITELAWIKKIFMINIKTNILGSYATVSGIKI